MQKILFKIWITLITTIPLSMHAQFPYSGGNGNGASGVSSVNISLSITDSLYNGGNGDGVTKNVLLNAVLSQADSMYKGGQGNGFHSIVLTNTTLNLLDSIYNGGTGRGDNQKVAPAINLSICTDVLVWNGNANINWDNPGNWDCGTVPGVNSIVIIPGGRPRYPTIFTNTVIKKLEMQPGASVTVFINRLLLINGQ